MSRDKLCKSYRRCWGRSETLALLESYSKHKKEFELPRKKKKAYSDLLMELIGTGVLEELTTTDMLESRVKTLLRAYRVSLRNPNRGAPPCVAPFLKQMKNIFGANPLITKHCKLDGESIEALDDSRTTYDFVEEISNSPSESDMKTPLEPYSSCSATSSLHPATSSFYPVSSSTGAAFARSETPEEKINPQQSYLTKNIAISEEMAEEKHEQRQQLLQKIEKLLEKAANAKDRRHRDKLALTRRRHKEELAMIERKHQQEIAVIKRLFKNK